MPRKTLRARGGASLACTKCGGPTEVLRTQRDDTRVLRTRYCAKCDRTMLTKERISGNPEDGKNWWMGLR